MKRNDTYWTVYQACDTYFKETGQIPVITVIRDRIGINSPNIISQAVKDFKGALADQVVKARKDLGGIPSPVVNIAIDLWEAAKAEAQLAANQRQDEMAAREREFTEKERQLNLELETGRQAAMQLNEELGQAKTKLQQAAERLSQAETKAEAESDAQRDKAAQLERRLAGLADELAQEKQRRISAEAAYEKHNDWAMGRIAEEKAFLKQQYTAEINQLKATVNKLKNDNLLLQAKLDKAVKPLGHDSPRPSETGTG